MLTRMLMAILMSSILISFNAHSAEATDVSIAEAIVAGGCFWCMEHPFDELPGVIKTTSGYTGGTVKNPTYEQVSSGSTGHFEALQILYNPTKISYEKLLEVFWHNIDPTDGNGQFCDKGNQYRSVIFYQGEQQKRIAEQSKATLEKNKPFPDTIMTLILPATEFFPAEEYHQDYYQKNPVRYNYYRFSCGRDNRLETLWGKP